MPYFKSGGLNIYYRKKGVEKKHSETAIYTALLRAIDNKEFIVLITLANIIAWPPGLFLMSHWLKNFSYHTSIGIGVFIAAGIVALTIALLTVSYQTFRAVTANPADRLRSE